MPYESFEQMPLNSDTDDKLNIRNVWFSFNSVYAWFKFSTNAKLSYDDNQMDRLFIIRPI